MSDRQPPEITESIAEALRAGVALIAVVLLARANVGALTKGPSVWVGLPVCFLVWAAAAGAVRWSRLSGGSRLMAGRDCVAPALVTLLISGSGGLGSLALGIGLVTIGAVAVGLAATCCRVDSPTDSPEPMPERAGEARAEPQRGEGDASGTRLSGSFALPGADDTEHGDRLSQVKPSVGNWLETSSRNSPQRLQRFAEGNSGNHTDLCAPPRPLRWNPPHDFQQVDSDQPLGECAQMNTPAPDDEAATQHQEHLPAALDEVVESTVNESIPAESWTRMESDGEVSIEAVVLARFVEGAKLAVVHLPFVPPLPTVPQIECEPLDSGCEVTIKTDAAYRHGARLSITRQSAGPAELVPIGVVVYTSAEEQIEL